MSADSSAVDAVISQKLLSDAPLMAIATDGVWFDVAKKGATRFVLVSRLAHEDTYMLMGSAFERFLYLVKAVALETTGANVSAAATRLHALLQDGTLNPAGYTLMRMQRVESVRFTEVDENNADARWQHRGGHYEVLVSPS
jgi:hypothetical protein